MKTRITLLTLMITLIATGCASSGLKSHWKEVGYAEEDMDAIHDQMKPYFNVLTAGKMSSNAFNGGAPRMQAREQLKSVFCACTKKLGKACDQPARGLASDDKELWVKHNAVAEAISSQESVLDVGPSLKIDPIECQ